MSPDPCDAREADVEPGFTLPCRCGAAVRAESLALRNEALLAQLARAHGKTVEAERVAQGLVVAPGRDPWIASHERHRQIGSDIARDSENQAR